MVCPPPRRLDGNPIAVTAFPAAGGGTSVSAQRRGEWEAPTACRPSTRGRDALLRVGLAGAAFEDEYRLAVLRLAFRQTQRPGEPKGLPCARLLPLLGGCPS